MFLYSYLFDKNSIQKVAKEYASVSGSTISITSGCELFLRFVTRQSLEIPEFEACKSKLLERGQYITKLAVQSREKIAQSFEPFFRDNTTVLVIGHSRVVLTSLIQMSTKRNKRFHVLVPEMRPDGEGCKTAKTLQELGIPVTLIMDNSVAFYMNKVDFVLSGAEGVVENGGIINKIGTYQMAILAKAHKKPFYVAAESYKFVRQYPLGQDDIENIEYINPPKFEPVSFANLEENKNLSVGKQVSDLTPPKYITLLFTDLGILTPSGISDELMRLFT